MPRLNKMRAEYAERGLSVLAVNYGDKPETIAAYFEREKFDMTVVRQTKDEVSRAFGVQVYPTIYVVNAEGVVSWRSASFDEDVVRAEVERVLPGK